MTSEMKYESKVTFDHSGGPGQKVMKRTVRLYNDSFLARPEDDKAIIMCSAMVPAPNSDFKADAQATMHVVCKQILNHYITLSITAKTPTTSNDFNNPFK